MIGYKVTCWKKQQQQQQLFFVYHEELDVKDGDFMSPIVPQTPSLSLSNVLINTTRYYYPSMLQVFPHGVAQIYSNLSPNIYL